MRKKKQHMDSPYVYLEGVEVTLSGIPESYRQADLSKLFREKTYGKVEYLLLDALTIFHYLNKANIERYLNHKLGEKKWADYSHVIKKLEEECVIGRVTYAEQVFYFIFPYAKEYMEKKSKLPSKERMVPQTSKEAILECASLAQWHISLLCGIKAKRSCFYEKIKVSRNEFFADSYMETTIKRNHFRIISFAFPKAGTDITAFFQKVINAWSIMEQTAVKNQITLTIFTISSLREMKAIMQMLKSMEELADRTVYFALEGNTMEFEGLTCIYYYDEDSSLQEDAIKTITIH